MTFTNPQMGAVGRTKAQKLAAGLNVAVASTPMDDVPVAYIPGNGVGVTFTGPGRHELLRSATVAISRGVTVDRLWHAEPSFSTVSEGMLHLLVSYAFDGQGRNGDG